RQGLDIYRANGCAYCHSQQVGQIGTASDVVLTETGTNRPALLAALRKVKPGFSEADANQLFGHLPQPVLQGQTKAAADAAVKTLNASGAKASIWIVPTGPDIARGWGKRRTVAEDFLYDDPVMLGSQRIGPDLANVGIRLPDPNWHLRHLYAPRSEVQGSTMPPYRYLFEKRRIERGPSPDALTLPPAFAPEPGYEIVPKPEATALVAYLMSLRADAPLFVAPVSVAAAPNTASTATNTPTAPDMTSTNNTPTNAPAK
ncbi:MAG TPA: ribosomal protein L7/L12, partial [Clostridia bacterium]|nr:ribosomal protein L7/L12 [Clostridia bacterium]